MSGDTWPGAERRARPELWEVSLARLEGKLDAIIASKPWYTKVSPAQGTPWAAWSILINAAASDTMKMVADNSNGISGIPLLATVTRMSVVKIGA